MKLSLVVLLLLAVRSLPAQNTASKSTTCKPNHQVASPAEIAYVQGDFKKASDLFTSEVNAAPADDRLRSAQIQNLLAKGDLEEATKTVAAFATADPSSGYAMIAQANLLMREGNLPEAYAEAAKAQKSDPCNPQTYRTLSIYETMIAMHAMAKRHIDLAHTLDLLDGEITRLWIGTLPRAEARTQLAALAETSAFSEKGKEQVKHYLFKTGERKPEQCRLVSPNQATTVPFSAIRYSPQSDPAYGLEMTMNGKKRRLELDTGASGLLITAGAAERLGLAIEERASFSGIGDEGRRQGNIAYVKQLKIGALEFENCEVGILPPRDTTAASYGYPVFMDDIDGLIGGDIFSQFLLTLDYPGGELRVSPLPTRPGQQDLSTTLETAGQEHGRTLLGVDGPVQDRYRGPDMQDWTQFYRIGHYLLIPTQLDDGPVKLMMADTGADESIISPDAVRGVTRVSSTNMYSLGGISGRTNKTYLTDRIVLHFANLFLPLKGMLSTETTRLSSGAGVEISGFIGFSALKQMTLQIDYRDGLIHFVFDPKRKLNPRFAKNQF